MLCLYGFSFVGFVEWRFGGIYVVAWLLLTEYLLCGVDCLFWFAFCILYGWIFAVALLSGCPVFGFLCFVLVQPLFVFWW